MALTKKQAARLLLQRQEAYDSLVGFARYVDIPGVPVDNSVDRYDVVETPLAAHHLLMLKAFQDMLDGNLKHKGRVVRRVMLMFPPGAAKSTYASVVFPAYVMGRNPGHEVILATYGDVLSKRHGTRCRQLCSSDAFESLFGCGLNPHKKSADDWGLANGSTYKAAGITSGITGFRCDGLIWDDLIKGRAEADSQTVRDATWNAYLDDARSRKKPEAWEVGIGTRWHEDDPLGRILPEGYSGESGFMECQDGNVWYVLCVAAQAERDDDPLGRERGEYLWPEWFGEGYWADKKVNPRSWASLYQQRPSPEEGIYFKRDMFKRYTSLPKEVNYYISFDPAVSVAEQGDQTAILVWAVDDAAKLYLVDAWVQKATIDVWVGQILTWVQLYKPERVIGEGGLIRRAAEPYIAREMEQRSIYAIFEYITRHADKSAMSRAAQAMYGAGQILHPETSISEDIEDELMKFPAGKNDHRVDAVANMCLYLESVWATNPPIKKSEKSGTIGGEIRVRDLMPPRFTKKQSRYAHRKKH